MHDFFNQVISIKDFTEVLIKQKVSSRDFRNTTINIYISKILQSENKSIDF